MNDNGSTSLTIEDVLNEEDVFRLAIRGFALVEELIADGIAEAFEGTMPSELKRLPFGARLALFTALTPFSEKQLKPLLAFAKVRHDFAHGRLNSLTQQRANNVASEFRAAFPKTADSALSSAQAPRRILVQCVIMATGIVNAARELAQKRRDAEQKAVRFQKDLKKLLAEHEVGG